MYEILSIGIFLFNLLFETALLYMMAQLLLHRRFRLNTWKLLLLLFLMYGLRNCYEFLGITSYARQLLNIALAFCCVLVFWKGCLTKQLFVALGLYSFIFLSDTVALFLTYALGFLPFVTFELYQTTLAGLLVAIAFWYCNMILLGRLYRRHSSFVRKIVNLSPAAALIPPTIICLITIFVAPTGSETNLFYSAPVVMYAIFAVILILLMAFLYSTLQIRSDAQHMKMINNIQRVHVLELYDMLRARSRADHDIKAIMGYFDSEDSYAKRLQETMDRQAIYTGNVLIDGMLDYLFMKRWRELEFDVSGSLPTAIDWLNEGSILIILTNAIDNAARAVLELDTDSRDPIELVFRMQEHILTFVIKNQTAHPIDTSRPIRSTKTEPGHGYGLKSIASSAEEHNGNMHVAYEGGWFQLSVYLQDPKG